MSPLVWMQGGASLVLVNNFVFCVHFRTNSSSFACNPVWDRLHNFRLLSPPVVSR